MRSTGGLISTRDDDLSDEDAPIPPIVDSRPEVREDEDEDEDEEVISCILLLVSSIISYVNEFFSDG